MCGCSNTTFCNLGHSKSLAATAFGFCSFDSAEYLVVVFNHMHQFLSLVGSIGYGYAVLQEESDAQYKNKGKKGSKADTKSPADAASKAHAAPTTASSTSTTAPTTDADKDVEMVDAPGASSSGDKKHVGEMTGEPVIRTRKTVWLFTQHVDCTSVIAAQFELDPELCV